MEKLMEFASSIHDFRRTTKGNIRHSLDDMIILIILARTSKCITRADIIEFGEFNLNKLQTMGVLLNGVPSEATLCRIEKGIDELELANEMQVFENFFHQELMAFCSGQEIICIDGKAMRGTVLENGRNPDIVSAYSYNTGLTLATEACREKSNEIKATPLLLDKIKVEGKIVTADAMSMQKHIIDKIREKHGDFLIELKANQPTLRYGVEDRLKVAIPAYTYSEGPELAHGRIETRNYRIYDGLEIIADKDKWGGNLTIIEFESGSIKKSTGVLTSEKRIYVSSLPVSRPDLGSVVRNHWSIESMHWNLDRNFLQDDIKRKSPKAARNLDTLQRIVLSLFSIWRGRRKKRSDKEKGTADLLRWVSMSFTRLKRFLYQK